MTVDGNDGCIAVNWSATKMRYVKTEFAAIKVPYVVSQCLAMIYDRPIGLLLVGLYSVAACSDEQSHHILPGFPLAPVTRFSIRVA